jgi:O-methyltransferase involved in polyketide biosynthesis
MSTARDFSSISPSAKSLLMVKSQTGLPFAKEAAELLWGTESVEAARRRAEETPGSEQRRRHFELRARSVDEALQEVGATRVLEIAGGLSFRGLAMAAREGIFYVDSDLPEIAGIKAELVAKLHPAPLRGSLRVQALDALDAEAFAAAAATLPAGPLAIVHEGLLMYLDDAEKAHVAANIRRALAERGGWWITADVYVRSESHLHRDERTQKFLEEHGVEDKKFSTFEAAERFFVESGFRILRRGEAASETWRVRQTWVMAV